MDNGKPLPKSSQVGAWGACGDDSDTAPGASICCTIGTTCAYVEHDTPVGEVDEELEVVELWQWGWRCQPDDGTVEGEQQEEEEEEEQQEEDDVAFAFIDVQQGPEDQQRAAAVVSASVVEAVDGCIRLVPMYDACGGRNAPAGTNASDPSICCAEGSACAFVNDW